MTAGRSCPSTVAKPGKPGDTLSYPDVVALPICSHVRSMGPSRLGNALPGMGPRAVVLRLEGHISFRVSGCKRTGFLNPLF